MDEYARASTVLVSEYNTIYISPSSSVNKNRIQVSLVPNITNICYGRGVGYKIEEIVLDEKTQQISATKIREQMRKEGKLK